MPGSNQNTNRNNLLSTPIYRLTFPQRVHCILEQVEHGHQEHLISWVNQGSAFKVHDSKAFERDLLPRYFSAKKYTSFTRALHAHGFKCERSGRDTGVFSHPWFNRNETEMLGRIRRTRPKKNIANAAIGDSRMPTSMNNVQNRLRRLQLMGRPSRFPSRLDNMIASSNCSRRTGCQLAGPIASDSPRPTTHSMHFKIPAKSPTRIEDQPDGVVSGPRNRYSILHDPMAPIALSSSSRTIAEKQDDQKMPFVAKKSPHLIQKLGLVSHTSTTTPSLLDSTIESTNSDCSVSVFGQLFQTIRSQVADRTTKPESQLISPTASANNIVTATHSRWERDDPVSQVNYTSRASVNEQEDQKQRADMPLATQSSSKREEVGSDLYNWISVTSLEPRSIQAMKKSPSDLDHYHRFCSLS